MVAKPSDSGIIHSMMIEKETEMSKIDWDGLVVLVVFCTPFALILVPLAVAAVNALVSLI